MPAPCTTTTSPATRRHDPSPELLARYAPQGRCVTDRFSACKIGGMLMTKLLGFIEDERAEILNVSESQVTLRLGRPWLQRVGRKDRRRPIEVCIQFAEPGEDLAEWQKTRARRSEVKVRLRPMSRLYPTRDFHRRADSILHTLRLHFVAD
jgi:hypothetical protein